MVTPDTALPGRSTTVLTQPTWHEVFGLRVDQVPAGTQLAHVAMGCFWGAEKLYWRLPGVKRRSSGSRSSRSGRP